MTAHLHENWLQENWKFLLPALLLHGGIAAMFLVTIASQPVRVMPQLAIQATVVDARTLRRLEQRQRREDAEAQATEQRAAAEEREKLQAEQRRKQEAEAAKTAAAERQAVEARQQAEAKQQADAKAQAAATERTRQAEAAREQRAAADKQRAAEIEKRQREAADQRKAQEAGRAQAAREAELKQQLAEETGRMQAESAGLNNQYAALIEQRIYRNWSKPDSARPGIECQVKVTQAPAGTVLSAEVGQCNGDAAVRQSIEAAVLRSSPLPPPPDPRLFQRNLLLIFKPLD